MPTARPHLAAVTAGVAVLAAGCSITTTTRQTAPASGSAQLAPPPAVSASTPKSTAPPVAGGAASGTATASTVTANAPVGDAGAGYDSVSRGFAMAFWTRQPTAGLTTPDLSDVLTAGRQTPLLPAGTRPLLTAVTLPEGEIAATANTSSVDVLVEGHLACQVAGCVMPAVRSLVLALTVARTPAGWRVERVNA